MNFSIANTGAQRKYLTSYRGLEQLGGLLRHQRLRDRFDRFGEQAPHLYSSFTALVGLFALGKTQVEEIDRFLTNRYFADALGIELLPSSTELKAILRERGSALTEVAHELHPEQSGSPAEALRELQTFALRQLERLRQLGTVSELLPTHPHFTAKVRDDLEKKGYAIIPKVLSTKEVSEARALVLDMAARERSAAQAYLYGNGGRCQRIYNLLNKHELFRELIQHPLLLAVMDHMFARNTLHDRFSLCSWHANLIGGGGEPSILHVDAAVPEPLPEWIIRANINFILDDFTHENGATQCLPGSHALRHKPRDVDQNRTDLVTMEAPAGSMTVWHGHLWHRSGENRTSRERIALLGTFAASHLREMCLEENHFRVIQPAVQESFSPTLRGLIGLEHGMKKGADFLHP